MTNVERVERDIAREKMFREAFMNGKEPTDEDRAAWALADAHNQMSLDSIAFFKYSVISFVVSSLI